MGEEYADLIKKTKDKTQFKQMRDGLGFGNDCI